MIAAALSRRATPLARLLARTAPRRCLSDEARTAAAAHRTSVTQHLWKLRESQAPPLRPDGSRLPADSRVVVAYDLTQDKELRNRYESAFGTLRVGRLLEDMDALAGSVAYLHVDDGDPETAPPILVTASMERLEVRDDTLALDEDYNLVGSLVWAGRSSLEIVAELRHKDNDAVALSAVFTFVARKRDGSGAHTVPPLTPDTAAEKQLFADAAAIQAKRKEQRQAAKDPSKQAESAAARDEQIEALLRPGRVARDFPGQADEGFVLMHETSLKNAITTQPQVRNTAGRVFGGALMRYALELAFATAYAFSGCRSGVLHGRIRPDAFGPRRCDAASMAFCAQVRADDAVHRASRLRPARRGRRAARLEEPRRPRLRPGPRLRRRDRGCLEAGAPRVDAHEQLLVCF